MPDANFIQRKRQNRALIVGRVVEVPFQARLLKHSVTEITANAAAPTKSNFLKTGASKTDVLHTHIDEGYLSKVRRVQPSSPPNSFPKFDALKL